MFNFITIGFDGSVFCIETSFFIPNDAFASNVPPLDDITLKIIFFLIFKRQ